MHPTQRATPTPKCTHARVPNCGSWRANFNGHHFDVVLLAFRSRPRRNPLKRNPFRAPRRPRTASWRGVRSESHTTKMYAEAYRQRGRRDRGGNPEPPPPPPPNQIRSLACNHMTAGGTPCVPVGRRRISHCTLDRSATRGQVRGSTCGSACLTWAQTKSAQAKTKPRRYTRNGARGTP